jgi:TonB family protein
MRMPSSAAAEIFSVDDIARAAGVSPADTRMLFDAAEIVPIHGYVRAKDAVRCVRLLRHSPIRQTDLFSAPPPAKRSPGTALAASGGIHLALAAVIAFLSWGVATSEPFAQPSSPTRLVFLATPGPGGGGGGGGLKQPKPPARAEMKSAAAVKSPIPPPRPLTARRPEPEVRRPVPPVRPTPTPAPVDPPPPAPRTVTPQVVAPVVTASSDPRDRAGVPAETAPDTESQGSGSGGGAGTGAGTGLGEGSGAGIGPGSGGGTGGGPYRPGAGITPPQLLREVRPDYTEDARRQGLEGDVVLEIVVRDDGSVGDVKILKGLGAGLDRRAVDAVRQWRFSPARRHGVAVDVMVEVAVEFKLR